ncbi:sigma-54-dependent transcriptional regulator [Edaphobacter albus]|uniref:sigma-54-dependent transcriptional regulator n=1 Tax=Edaphobacter sp. 4G125 TaxID=2763071 RepID=UPI001648928F|nr:sigma-54 dependent transcriptional regulator [Edaphobacter sp. 4G125]QNI35793.1 sigma-54-dependent Fis family transcriptional regulator [Edaphobacter sp. 4G125]
MARVLVVEDEPNMRKVLTANLRQDGHVLVEAATVRDGLQAVYGNDFEVALLDQKLPDGEGSEVLRAIQQSEPSTAVVVLTAYGTVELAVEAMRSGAFDFLTKPFSSDNLRAVVSRAAEWSSLQRENYLLRNTVDRLEGQSEIRGSSPSVVKLRQLISRVGPTEATALITGETGTGKELVARAIHKSSTRANKPLISVNCAAFSETLLESELFGHERGSFTGADRVHHGLFEAAHEGTLFLDEAGEMSAAAQAKLLRVLAEGKITRVGSTVARDVDVRVLAATHRDLKKEVQEGNFRQDLYYRLAIVPIEVPPLRERVMDIPEIAEYLLRQITSDLKTAARTLHPDALQQLMSYNFPGNVRELRNLLERACILTSSPEILWFDLPEILQDEASTGSGFPVFSGAQLPDEFHLRSTLAAWERTIIEQTLAKTNGSKTEAARRLGLSKSDLSYKLSKYGL